MNINFTNKKILEINDFCIYFSSKFFCECLFMNTPEQIRNNFFRDGYSISQWAKDNNFPVDLVYKVLSNNRIPSRGKSHQIAIKLGMKEINI